MYTSGRHQITPVTLSQKDAVHVQENEKIQMYLGGMIMEKDCRSTANKKCQLMFTLKRTMVNTLTSVYSTERTECAGLDIGTPIASPEYSGSHM